MAAMSFNGFASCGWPAWAVVACAVVALLLAVVALVLVLRRVRVGRLVALVALAVAFTPYGVGMLGTSLGRGQVDAALAGADEDNAKSLRAAGYAEAGQCMEIGKDGAMLPLMLAAVAIVAGAVRPAGAKRGSAGGSEPDTTGISGGAA